MRRRKRHAIEMRRSWNIALRVDVGSACVDRGQSPLTYLLLLFLLLYTIYGVIVILQRWLLTCVEMVQKLVNRVPSFSTEAVVGVRSTFLSRILWLPCRVWFLIECKDYRVSFHVSPPVKKSRRRTTNWDLTTGYRTGVKLEGRWAMMSDSQSLHGASLVARGWSRRSVKANIAEYPGPGIPLLLSPSGCHRALWYISHTARLFIRDAQCLETPL